MEDLLQSPSLQPALLPMEMLNSFSTLNSTQVTDFVSLEMRNLKRKYAVEQETYVQTIINQQPIIVGRREVQQISDNSEMSPTFNNDTSLNISPKVRFEKSNRRYTPYNNMTPSGYMTPPPQMMKQEVQHCNNELYMLQEGSSESVLDLSVGQNNAKPFKLTYEQADAEDISEEEKQDILRRQRAASCRRSRINNKVKKTKAKHRCVFALERMRQSVDILEYYRNYTDQFQQNLLLQGVDPAVISKMRLVFGVDK